MGRAHNLARLRLDAARRIRDGHELTATANGTTTTVIDLDHAAYADNSFKGREIYCFSGTAANLGLARRVDSSVGTTGTLTLNRALPSATAANDVFHLYNYRDTGLYLSDWTSFVQEAFAAVDDTWLFEKSSTAIVFDREEPVIELDDAPLGTDYSDGLVWGVWGVDYEDSSFVWHECNPNDLRLRRSYTNVAMLEIRGRSRELCDGRYIRINSYVRVSMTDVDTPANWETAETLLDAEYVKAFAAARACSAIVRNGGADAAWFAQEATRLDAFAQRRATAARRRQKPSTMQL